MNVLQFTSPENHVYDADGKDLDRHDEIDFEFLGNTTGEPTTLQTNVYLEGKGNREQRHYLPFDPSADFHKYSLLWNKDMIVYVPLKPSNLCIAAYSKFD